MSILWLYLPHKAGSREHTQENRCQSSLWSWWKTICQCDFMCSCMLESMCLQAQVCVRLCGCMQLRVCAYVCVCVRVLVKQSVSVLTAMSHAGDQSQGIPQWELLITLLCLIPTFNPGCCDFTRSVTDLFLWEGGGLFFSRCRRSLRKVLKVTHYCDDELLNH